MDSSPTSSLSVWPWRCQFISLHLISLVLRIQMISAFCNRSSSTTQLHPILPHLSGPGALTCHFCSDNIFTLVLRNVPNSYLFGLFTYFISGNIMLYSEVCSLPIKAHAGCWSLYGLQASVNVLAPTPSSNNPMHIPPALPSMVPNLPVKSRGHAIDLRSGAISAHNGCVRPRHCFQNAVSPLAPRIL